MPDNPEQSVLDDIDVLWKPIPKSAGYEVSNRGDVRSLDAASAGARLGVDTEQRKGCGMSDRNPESEVVDRIQELVDWQLSKFDERSGYDHNVNQAVCRICGEDTHTLPITEGLQRQRTLFQRSAHECDDRLCARYIECPFHLTDAQRAEMDAYSYATDDTRIVCPGSDFIGPWASKAQIERMRNPITIPDGPPMRFGRDMSVGEVCVSPVDYADADRWRTRPASLWMAYRNRADEMRTYSFPVSPWRLPENPFNPNSWAAAAWTAPAEGELPDEAEPTPTPRQRALPRPSTTPPMWAVDPNRRRRQR